MKVGILHNAYLQRGGEDVVVEQEYELLRSHNIPVCILYFKNASGRVAQLKNYLSSFYNMGSYRLVSKWISSEKPDIIHVHNWHYQASPSIFRAARNKGVPVVHTLHNFRLLCPSATLLHDNKLFLTSLHSSFPWAAVVNRVYRDSYFLTFLLAFTIWLHRISGTWSHINKFIVLTENAKQVFKSSNFGFTDKQIAVKPNFIPYLPVDVQKEPRGNHFLFVGRLSEEKGVDILLEAFAQSKHRLAIIGTGPLLKVVKRYAKQHSNITYLGFQNKAFIINELKKCTASIFPSVWYEGSPLTIIESLACGTPVIASALGAMESMITHQYNGLHIQAGDVSDLKCKLDAWQNMPAEQQQCIRQNARTSYETKYTPEKNFEQLLSIYKSMKDE